MEIVKVENLQGSGKGSLRGFTVTIESENHMPPETFLRIGKYDFEVYSVETTETESLIIKAKETGDPRSRPGRRSIDVRELLGEVVKVINDEETIKKIRISSTYC